MYLQLVRNPGAAFSLATGYTWVLTLVALAVVVVIVRVARRLRSHRLGAGARAGARRGAGQPGRPLLPRARAAAGPRRRHGVAVRAGRPVLAGVQRRRLRIVIGGVLLVLLALLGRELDGTRSTAGRGRDGARRD